MRQTTTASSVLSILLVVVAAGIAVDRTAASAAAIATSAAPVDDLRDSQVRAKYIDLNGNRDETTTTCFLVNKS